MNLIEIMLSKKNRHERLYTIWFHLYDTVLVGAAWQNTIAWITYKQQKFISGSWESKFKAQAVLVSGESPLTGS